MTDFALIRETRHTLPLGRYYTTYEWEGKPWQVVRISMRHGETVRDFPWKLRPIGSRNAFGDYQEYMREDGWLYPLALLTDLRVRVGWGVRWVYARLIMTAMVWGLADVKPYEEPSWRHLFRKG